MTTIEDKIKMFSNIVNEKIQGECEKEFQAFENEKGKILNEVKERLEVKEKQALEEVVKRASIRANELLAKEKLEKQRALLSLKKQLFQELLEEVCERVKNYTEGEEYKEYLFNSIRASVAALESGCYVVFVKSEDIEKNSKEIKDILDTFKGKSFEIRETEKEFIGGIIVEDKECRFRIDNSLNSKLQQLKPYIGEELMERLG